MGKQVKGWSPPSDDEIIENSNKTNLSSDEEVKFQSWRLSLPKNLQEDNENYDLRGAWKAGLEPDEEGHLQSRDPKSGLILKSPKHPTFHLTVKGEEEAGYEIYQSNGRYYSKHKQKSKSTWQPPSDDEIVNDGSVKKKESTSTSTSGSDLTEPGKPSAKKESTYTPTPEQQKQLSQIKIEKPKDPEQARFQSDLKKQDEQIAKDYVTGNKDKAGVAESVKKGAVGLVTDILPQAFAQARAAGTRVEPYTDKDLTDREAISDAANFLFRKNVSEGKYLKALSIGDKEAIEYIKEQINKPEEYQAQQIAEKIRLLGVAQKEQQEFQEYTKNVNKQLSDISTPSDVAGYVGYTIGQALPQIGLSLMSGGMSSYLQEYGEIYDQQVQKIAEDKGISVDEVVKQGLDDPEAGQIAGVLAAALDRVGVEAIFKNFGKDALKNILKSGSKIQIAKQAGINALKTSGAESATEAGQSVIEQSGSSLGAGRSVSESIQDISGREVLESAVAGGVSGLFMSGAGSAVNTASKLTPEQAAKPATEVIKEEVNTVNPDDIQSLDAAAETIQAKVDNDQKAQTTSTQTTPAGTEVPEVAQEESVPVQAETTSETQTVISNEPQETVDSVSIGEAKPEVEGQGEVRQGSEIVQETATTTGQSAQQRPVLERNQDTGLSESATSTASVTKESTPAQESEELQAEQSAKSKTLKIAKRILDSDASDKIKEGIRSKGAEYIPKKLEVTDKEAKDLIDLYGPDKSEALIRDTKNDVTGDTRTALAAKLYEKYKNDADSTSDPQEKQRLYNKAVDIALVAADQAKEAGRAVNANKIWKLITSDEDATVIALEKENKKVATQLIEPIQKQVLKTKQQFDEEIRRLIEQKVTEGVEQRLKRAKLITSDKKKAISDAFDSLKVKDVKGTANDIIRVVGASVWNGSMEAVKRAVLTGADIVNAVQAGIDYIRDNYQGDFNEDEFRNMVTPQIEPLIPKEEVKATDVDETKIKTPKLKGKKKKDFIQSAVDEYNKTGTISDEKFEELYAKQIGYREYTDAERVQIRNIAKVITEAEKFEQEVKDNFTPENIAKYKDLMAKARKANQQLQEFARQPSNIWDTLITMMQGNLLTPLSIVTNVYSNAALQPLRFMSAAIGSGIDRSVSTLAKMGYLDEAYKNPTIDLKALQKGYFKGSWDGVLEGLMQLKEGQLPDEKNLREIQSSFSPTRAVKRWADSDRSLSQKINDYVEGTFGWPAEGMFRLLNLGDKPFRKAAELAKAVEIAEQRKLEGNDRLKFLMFPDDTAKEQIKQAGDEATFQQESKASKAVQNAITWLLNSVESTPVIGGPAKVLLKSQVPFVKTPLNIVIETFDYAMPPVTLVRGISAIKNGEQRKGAVLIGKALTGAIIIGAAKSLFELGLLSWEDDDDKKGRTIQYDTVPPNSLNVSALSRGLAGQGFEVKDDDTWVNYKKLGIIGILFDNYSNNYYKAKKEGEEMPGVLQDMFTSAPRVASSALEQSFLKGTNSLLNAIQDGGGYDTQQWAIETTGAISSTVYPNTLSTISKSSDEFLRDTYSRDFTDRLRDTYKAKMFMGESLPSKVNLWGEKVRGNPEGRNKFIYYLFDPTKFKNVDTDSYQYKLYDAWKTDNFNNDWLPSAPNRNLSYRGVKVKLSPKEFESLSIYIGKERARMVQAYVNTGWRYNNNERRVERLREIYREGYERGKDKFLMNSGWNVLTPKKLEALNEKR